MGPSRFVVTEAGRPVCAALGATSAESLLALPGGEPVATSRGRWTVRLTLADGTTGYLKRYRILGWRGVWRGLLRGVLAGRHAARREWDALATLAGFRLPGLDVPERLALGEVRSGGLLRGAALLVRGVAGAEPLHAWLAARAGRAAAARERREVAEALGTVLGRLHATGWVDGGCHARNWLLRSGTPLTFVKLDSPRGRHRTFGRRAGVIADLAALDAVGAASCSRPERLRFLRAWHAAGGPLAPDPALATAVAASRRRQAPREAPRLREAFAHAG